MLPDVLLRYHLEMALVLEQKLLQAHLETVSFHFEAVRLGLQPLLHLRELCLLVMHHLYLLFFETLGCFILTPEHFLQLDQPCLLVSQLLVELLDLELVLALSVRGLDQLACHVRCLHFESLQLGHQSLLLILFLLQALVSL